MTRKTVLFYYLLSALNSIAIALPVSIYVIFIMSNELNLFEVNLVNLFFYLAVLIFEVPTGAIADLYGRKFSCAISFIGSSVGLFIYGLSDSFLGFVIAEVVLGISRTFSSGAIQAWFVDRVNYFEKINDENFFTKIFSREQQISRTFMLLGVLVGSFMAEESGMNITWILGGTFMIVASLVVVIFMKEEYFEKRKIIVKNIFSQIKDITKTSIEYATKNTLISFLLIVVAIQTFCFQGPNMQWQPRFFDFFENKITLGIIFVGMSLCLIIGSSLSVWFVKKIGIRNAILLPQSITGLFILISSFSIGIPIVILSFLFHEVTRGSFYPIGMDYLNQNIDSSKERATIISVESLVSKLGGIFGLLFSGFLAQEFSISVSWFFSGGILLISMLILFNKNKATVN